MKTICTIRRSFYLVFLLLLQTSPLFSRSYLLNSRNSQNTAIERLPLSQEQEERWLRSFVQKVTILADLDTSSLKASDGRTLKENMQRASNLFLSFQVQEALEIVDECLSLIRSSMPYRQMQSDLKDLFSLKLMILAAQEDPMQWSFDNRPDILPWIDELATSSKLPVKVQAVLANRASQKVALPAEVTATAERLFVSGKEISPEKMIAEGRHLIHVVKPLEIVAYSLDLRAKGTPVVTQLWKRPLWDLPQQAVRSAIEASRPAGLAPGGILLATSPSSAPLLISSPPLTKAVQATPFVPRAWNDLPVEEEREASSLFQSPWFWVTSTVIAGSASYFVYEASQTKRVSTP